jgi:hypothetical protein
MATKLPYRPARGFITETPSKRVTAKSAFLKRLEREQRTAARDELIELTPDQLRAIRTRGILDPQKGADQRKVVPFRRP